MRNGGWRGANRAILYNLTLLGEAANNVSREFAAAHPEVDFKDMAGLRHKLVHDYANIDLSVIWKVLQSDGSKCDRKAHP